MDEKQIPVEKKSSKEFQELVPDPEKALEAAREFLKEHPTLMEYLRNV